MTFGIDKSPDPDALADARYAAVQQAHEAWLADARYAAVQQAHESVVAETRAADAAAINLKLWDIRLAAILNTLSLAMEHGQHRDWTHDHSRQIREMLAIVNEATASDGMEIVPPGFGPVVRTAHAAALVKIAARVNGAAPAGDGAGTEGAL